MMKDLRNLREKRYPTNTRTVHSIWIYNTDSANPEGHFLSHEHTWELCCGSGMFFPILHEFFLIFLNLRLYSSLVSALGCS
jgi:hypothetical protein